MATDRLENIDLDNPTKQYEPKPKIKGFGCIPCAPFPTNSVEVEETKGFARAKQKSRLTELNVVLVAQFVIPNSNETTWLLPGNSIVVRSETNHSQWAKEVFTMDGVEFILVPATSVVMTRR
jgi:hypothetical protein